MGLDQTGTEAICWAEIATADTIGPDSRKRFAFKWKDGQRVQSVDPATKAPLVERIPIGAHYGTRLTGIRPARDIVSTVRMLRDNGAIVDMKVNNGPAHHVEGDDRYQLNAIRKAAHYGWIKVGECPASLVVSGAISAAAIVSPEAKDGQPCGRHLLGVRNPPCKHFLAEEAARVKATAAKFTAQEESAKTAESRILASNAESTAATQAATLELLTKQGETQAALVAALVPQGKAK